LKVVWHQIKSDILPSTETSNDTIRQLNVKKGKEVKLYTCDNPLCLLLTLGLLVFIFPMTDLQMGVKELRVTQEQVFKFSLFF